MADNIETPEEVGTSSPPDFSGLEEALNNLQQTLETQMEQQAEEKALQEQKEIEDAENAELVSSYQENLLSSQTDQADTLTLILKEMQSLNEKVLLQEEMTLSHHTEMKQLQAEGFLSLIIALVVVAAIRVFIAEISRW